MIGGCTAWFPEGKTDDLPIENGDFPAFPSQTFFGKIRISVPRRGAASRPRTSPQPRPFCSTDAEHRWERKTMAFHGISMGFPQENYGKMLTWPNKNGDLVGFHGTNHGITNDFMGENDGVSTIFLASPRNPREFHNIFLFVPGCR